MVKSMKREKLKTNPIFKLIIIILLILFCLLLYSRFISTSGLKVKEYKIVNENISDNFHGLKIIHISDIHFGSIINSKRLEKLVEKINFIKPDIVVLTGDLIDRDTKLNEQDIEDISNNLKKINANIEKYAIRGNHDYYFSDWETIIENGNFINLDNNYDYIYKDGYEPILITGLSSIQDSTDFTTRYDNLHQEIENQDINSIYQILLIHEPDLIDNITLNNYNLVLAGHSHNGQIRLPFIGSLIKVDGAKKYYDEYYQIEDTQLYISGGIGTSNLDFRFFNKPSFNLYRLTNK